MYKNVLYDKREKVARSSLIGQNAPWYDMICTATEEIETMEDPWMTAGVI